MTSVVFITGASSGIGRALAEHYARAGATLGLAARRADRLAELDAELRTLGAAGIETYPLDVADAPALATAAQDFIARRGTPDIVVYPVSRHGWGRLTRLLSIGNLRTQKGGCILELGDLLDFFLTFFVLCDFQYPQEPVTGLAMPVA